MRIGIIQAPYPDHETSSYDTCSFIQDSIENMTETLELLVLPEYANCPGISDHDELIAFVNRYSDSFLAALQRLAREKRTNIALNALLEEPPVSGRKPVFRNSTLLIGRDGNEIARYEKIHLTPTEKEWGVVAGERPVMCRLEGARITFATCFDIYFAEYFERLAAMQPDLLLFPSYQRSEDQEIIRLQTRSRAVDLEAGALRTGGKHHRWLLHGGRSVGQGAAGCRKCVRALCLRHRAGSETDQAGCPRPGEGYFTKYR